MNCDRVFNEISHDNNMAFVRYVLSFCVLISHTATLSSVDLPLKSYSFVAVGGFFALSGFLLFGSFQRRPSIKHYFNKRARRILPPYYLVVIVCALVLVTVSSLSFKDYYSSTGFWEYLGANLSFLNFLQPSLPGVFEGSEFYEPAVNGSLWTMKGEWVCYISVPVIYYFISKNRRPKTIISTIILICLVLRLAFMLVGDFTGRHVFYIIEKQFSTIFVFFFAGAFINLVYDKFLKYKWYVLLVDIVIIVFSGYYEELYYLFFRPLVIASLVIWFSQVGKWGYFMRNHEDLSYDIYLFHYPVIQLAVLWGLPERMSPYLLLLIIASVTALLAYISWNLVGRRFMLRPDQKKVDSKNGIHDHEHL